MAAFALAAIGFIPLFGQPGYEYSLASGLILPPIAAVSCAWNAIAKRSSPTAVVLHGIAFGILLALLAIVVSLLHGLTEVLCQPVAGTAMVALGGGSGAVMAAIWGSILATLAPVRFGQHGPLGKRRWRTALALAAPALGIALSLGRFYSSPMVFATDPFFGYFAGPLYDTVNDPLQVLTVYRVGSLLTILAILSVAAQLRPSKSGAWSLKVRFPLLLSAMITGGLSLAFTLYGEQLGHRSSSSSIREALSAETRFRRCTVFHHPEYRKRDARLLARSCEVALSDLERFFGLPRSEQGVSVFLFASPDEKARLMGALHTEVAKPWRGEIYLSARPFPHPVLDHELAHAVAGRFGQGPLKIAGPLWGLVPDPGRIEGFAVAASPARGSLTLAQSALAMKRLGLLPPLRRLFALSFIGYSGSAGYTTAGAFVAWLREEIGTDALRQWYGGLPLERAAKRSLARLERDWHQSLEAASLTQAELATARRRFDRPAIFGRICPRLIDRLRGEAAQKLRRGDLEGAEAAFRAVLDRDSSGIAAEMGLAACALRRNERGGARALYDMLLAREALSQAELASVNEAAGDLFLLEGKLVEARVRYDRASTLVANPAVLRALEVKRAAETKLGRQAIAALLLGDRTDSNWPEAVEHLARWSETSDELGLADYLLGKNWYVQGEYELAARSLERALVRGGLGERTLREALRVALTVASALGQAGRVESLAKQLLELPSSEAEAERAQWLVARCRALNDGA